MDYESEDGRDQDDDDEFEEAGGSNRLLGFMFGNVDNAGDLDVDYLDEDAKEHLAALADKLGPSLTDIDLSVKSPQTPGDASDQDFDKKAEDALNFEDIEEPYEGPETEAATEEDYLLPKKEFLSSIASAATLVHTKPILDDENYDEDEETEAEINISGSQTVSISGEHAEDPISIHEEKSSKDDSPVNFPEAETLVSDLADMQEDLQVIDDPYHSKSSTPLPILCIEDGMVILRFSEIFGIHEPLKKGARKDRSYEFTRETRTQIDAYDVEDDEEAFLKGCCQGFSVVKQALVTQDDVSEKLYESELENFGIGKGVVEISNRLDSQGKASFCSAQPMKEDASVDLSATCQSQHCPEFYPIDQQDWEERIIWGNSPAASDHSFDSSDIVGPDLDTIANGAELDTGSRPHNFLSDVLMEPVEKDSGPFFPSSSVIVEPFGSRYPGFADRLSESRCHPQLLRLESRMELDDTNDSNSAEGLYRSNARKHLNVVALKNRDILEGSWLDKIIWDPDKPVAKPKLILDLRDEQMLFEVIDSKDAKHLRLHAGAMIIAHSMKSGIGEPCELQCHAGPLGRFNIANDKFYSSRKTSQQLKSHSKKRTAHGIKVLHSIPALQLLTMKPKLSNKDIANFHRPKGIWYPHDNEVAMKELGKLDTYGPMKIILKNLGGKGIKLHVDVEETISSVKGKASKKLDFKPSEIVKIYYVGKELEDSKTLAAQNVRPNSVLHLVRTKIHVLSRAQRLPGENKSLRPPGAFKKKSDLSAKDGHVFLMEYCEERPLLLGNVGMGARLCTYYQKSAPGDQTGSHLRNDNSNLGTILTLDPADKSPFLGEIKPGCSQSCLETNMYRAPIFPHKVSSTDYLLVRSAKGKLSIRRIDRIHIVGQQEPHMEVMSPGSKGLQTYIMNRLLVYMYRGFHALEKRGLPPHIRADELSAQFPNISEPFLRKRLKHCSDLQRPRGEYFWIMRRNFRIPLEEELRRMVTPESVCAYESMLAGHHRLKRLGITKLTNPAGLSAAMNQLPYEAIALAAAAHIERELQITPWNLSSNFVSCTNQDRGNIERLEITGVGDPSGRGLGFSYVRTAPKAPISSAVVKKKISVSRGGSTVTGTDADLRRLSMEAAREVLLKFNVPDEQIAKQTRWHRIAMIRKLSSEQAASGVKVDPTTISKYARGQRMSFLQLQQQTREKCQEIWDRQFQSLSVIEGDENDSDSEANSDLDSFAGDLENLLDAEGCEEGEEGNCESQRDKTDGVKGLKMRRHQSQTQEDVIEDEESEAADLCRILMDDDVSDRKKKKKTKAMGDEAVLVRRSQTTFGIANDDLITKSTAVVKQINCATQPNGAYASKESIQYPKDVDTFHAKKKVAGTPKGMRKNDIPHILLNKKVKIMGDGVKMIKEKKSARETFVCGACGQLGHMRTNKNCPKYGEDHEIHAEIASLENRSGKSNSFDPSTLPQQRPLATKTLEKSASKNSLADALEGENCSSTVKALPVKFKCGGTVSAEKFPDQATPGISSGAEHPGTSQSEPAIKSATKVTKIIISNKMKAEDAPVESHKPSIVIRPPAETDRERTRKKIIIKRPKEIINLDQISQDGSIGHEYRKTKKIVELSSFERHTRQESMSMDEEATKRKAIEEKKWWEEEEKRRNEERQKEEKARKRNEEMRFLEEQERLSEIRRYEEAIRNEREEEERQKAKKRKKKVKKIEIKDDYVVEDYRARRNEIRLPVRDVTTKRRSLIESARNNEYTQPTKRRRSGEVGLANILERIVDILRDRQEVSYLFLKPVSRKEAPDYLDIIERPMDLSTIKEKVRRMEYKHHSEFSHDVWQISYNAHKYNDGRNPGIPPLADQLLEICEYLIIENEAGLAEAEDSIARSG